MSSSLRIEWLRGLNPNHGFFSKLRNAQCLYETPRASTSTRFLTLHHTTTSSFVLAYQNPKHGEIEVENENDKEESREAWERALDTLREQTLKIQSVSREAYELYSKEAVIVLKDTAKQLNLAAEEIAKAAENSPELKEIVETITSTNEVSELRDFNVGIPYGLVLSLGGFVSFMVTGSIAAIRFGIVLGGVLLALSISSLRSYRRGQPSPLTLKGQAAIASILFLREIRLLAEGSPPVTYFTALISGVVVALFVYRLVLERKQQYNSNLETGEEN